MDEGSKPRFRNSPSPQNSIVSERFRNYPDKIGKVGSTPTDTTKCVLSVIGNTLVSKTKIPESLSGGHAIRCVSRARSGNLEDKL